MTTVVRSEVVTPVSVPEVMALVIKEVTEELVLVLVLVWSWVW